MRVIAGKYKSRKLKAVPSKNTRPTTDKNKENLFNIIGPYFQGGVCLDLFGGSGSLGIEAISRGIKKLYSIDCNYMAYKTIYENVKSLNMNEEIHVLKCDYQKALQTIDDKFDLVFLDPPYGKNIIPSILIQLQKNHQLNHRCIVVCEDLKDEIFEDRYDKLYKRKSVTYGITSLHIYEFGE